MQCTRQNGTHTHNKQFATMFFPSCSQVGGAGRPPHPQEQPGHPQPLRGPHEPGSLGGAGGISPGAFPIGGRSSRPEAEALHAVRRGPEDVPRRFARRNGAPAVLRVADARLRPGESEQRAAHDGGHAGRHRHAERL